MWIKKHLYKEKKGLGEMPEPGGRGRGMECIISRPVPPSSEVRVRLIGTDVEQIIDFAQAK
jgi:hypothetical protein